MAKRAHDSTPESTPPSATDEEDDQSADIATQLSDGSVGDGSDGKKSVRFDGGVTVYYFPRVQGFTCVPSQGGSTLGMGERHSRVERYTLSEHARQRRTVHRQILADHQRQGRIVLPPDFDSAPAGDWAIDEYYFLQPVPAKQRRALLHEAGVADIDPTEREECRFIRASRGRCGCLCRDVCERETCFCFRAGIRCQVDQLSFPCACTAQGCGNPQGRVEFNAARVRAHFIHTVLRLNGAAGPPPQEQCVPPPPPTKRLRLDTDELYLVTGGGTDDPGGDGGGQEEDLEEEELDSCSLESEDSESEGEEGEDLWYEQQPLEQEDEDGGSGASDASSECDALLEPPTSAATYCSRAAAAATALQ